MDENWQMWCRFCANPDTSDYSAINRKESIEYHMEIVRECFSLPFASFAGGSAMCGECSTFLSKVQDFRDHCIKVDSMFNELLMSSSFTDLQSIRFKYGLDSSEEIIEDLRGQFSDEFNVEFADVKQEEYDEAYEVMEEQEKEFLVEFEEEEATEPAKNSNARKKEEKVLKICNFCLKTYNSQSGLRDHILTKHSHNQDLKPFTCFHCPKQFPTRTSLRSHEKSHQPRKENPPVSCEFCQKMFSSKTSLRTHVETLHKKNTLYVCDVCEKKCSTRGNLKEHRTTHSVDFPFQCSYCPKKFKNMPNKRRHEDIHTDTKYECPHCGIMSNTKRNLQHHLLVHTDKKRFICKTCGKAFKRRTALKYHEHHHTGKKPYPCQHCEKSFTSKINLEGHQKKNHLNVFEEEEDEEIFPQSENDYYSMLEGPNLSTHQLDHQYA